MLTRVPGFGPIGIAVCLFFLKFDWEVSGSRFGVRTGLATFFLL